MKFIEIDKNVFILIRHFRNDEIGHSDNNIVGTFFYGFTQYETDPILLGKTKFESYGKIEDLADMIDELKGHYQRKKQYNIYRNVMEMQINVEEDPVI